MYMLVKCCFCFELWNSILRVCRQEMKHCISLFKLCCMDWNQNCHVMILGESNIYIYTYKYKINIYI